MLLLLHVSPSWTEWPRRPPPDRLVTPLNSRAATALRHTWVLTGSCIVRFGRTEDSAAERSPRLWPCAVERGGFRRRPA